MPLWFLWLFLAILLQQSDGYMDHLIPHGKSVDFSHQTEVYFEDELVARTVRSFKAANHNDSLFSITTNEQETDSTLALLFDGSILSGIRGTRHDHDRNYKKSMASLFLLPETWNRQEYHPINDSLGSCEWDIVTSHTTNVRRDLSRCSNTLSGFLDTSGIGIPVLPLIMDTYGSNSECVYTWVQDKRKVKELACTDTIFIGPRFTGYKVQVRIASSLKAKSSRPAAVLDLTNMEHETSLVHRKIEKFGSSKISMDNVMSALCEDDQSLESLLKQIPLMFEALKSADNYRLGIPTNCPAHIRKLSILAAALLRPDLLEDIVTETKILKKQNHELVPSFADPIVTLALANLGTLDTPLDQTIFHYEQFSSQIMSNPMTIAGLSGMVNGMVTRNQIYQDIASRILDVSESISLACSSDPVEATRVLHATSKLIHRDDGFFNATAPCLSSEDPVLHLAVLNSFRDMNCLENTKEAQIHLLQVLVDPEIKIAAFQGLVQCELSDRVLSAILGIFKEDSKAYSKQVASYAYSYIQATVQSPDPAVKPLKRIFEENSLDAIESPLLYDIKQHSRRIEYFWKLDQRNGILITVDVIWSRMSPFPSSITIGTKVIHEDISYPLFTLSTRIAGLGQLVFQVPFLETLWRGLTADSKEELLEMVQSSVKQVWVDINGFTKESILSLVNKYKTRRPLQYKLSQANLHVSLDLFGQPVYHRYVPKLKTFLSEVLTYLQKPNIIAIGQRNEFWSLIPLLQQSLPIITSSGLPIQLKANWHSIAKSVRSQMSKNNFLEMDNSLGFAFKAVTSLVIGNERDVESSVPFEYIEDMTLPGAFKITQTSEMLFNLPLLYQTQLKDNSLELRYIRPDFNPHHLFRFQSLLSVNDIEKGIPYKQTCLLGEKVIDICQQTLIEEYYPEKMFKNALLRPQNYALVVKIMEGKEPILIVFKKPSRTRERVFYQFDIKLKSGNGDHVYPGTLAVYKSSVVSMNLMLNLKPKRYVAKVFWPTSLSDDIQAGLEGSIEDQKTSLFLKMGKSRTEEGNLWHALLSCTDPKGISENILTMKKETSGNGWLAEAVSGKVIERYISFLLMSKHSQMRDVTDFRWKNSLVIPALSIDTAVDTSYTVSRYKYGLEFNGHWREDSLGVKAEWAPFKQKVAEYLPDQVQEALQTDLYNISVNVTHSSLFPTIIATTKAEINTEMFKSDWILQIGDSNGSVLFQARPTSWTDFQNLLTVNIDKWNVHYNIVADFFMAENDIDATFQLAWSKDVKDKISLHAKSEGRVKQYIPNSFNVQAQVYGYEVGAQNVVEETVTGYNSNVRLTTNLNLWMQVKSVYIIGISAVRSSYGLSTEATSSLWDDTVFTMGTLTCMKIINSCTLSVTSRRAADDLLSITTKSLTSPGVSTQTFIEVSLDALKIDFNANTKALHEIGSFNGTIVGNMLNYNKHLEGELYFNWKNPIDSLAGLEISRADDLNILTGKYRGEMSIIMEKRVFDTKHKYDELGDNSTRTWNMTANGRVGEELLDSHYAKGSVVTPDGDKYDAGANIYLSYSNETIFTHVTGKSYLSLNLPREKKYLAEASFDTNYDDYVFDYPVPEERFVFAPSYGTTLGEIELDVRLITPSSGESKIKLVNDRVLIIEDDRHVKTEGKVSLITKSAPNLGRMEYKLIRSEKSRSYSAKGSYLDKELSWDSYVIRNTDHSKLSYQLKAIDPHTDWSEFTVSSDLELGRNYPEAAKIAFVGDVSSMNFPNTNIRLLIVKSSNESGGEISLSTPYKIVPSGQLSIKWYPNKMDFRIIRGEGKAILVISNNGTWNTVFMDGALEFPPTDTHLQWTNKFEIVPDKEKLWKRLTHTINMNSKTFGYVYQMSSHIAGQNGNHSLVVGSLSESQSENNMLRVRMATRDQNITGRIIVNDDSHSYGANVFYNLKQDDGSLFEVVLRKAEHNSTDRSEDDIIRFDVQKHASSIELDLRDVSEKLQWGYNYRLFWTMESEKDFVDSIVANDTLTIYKNNEAVQAILLFMLNVKQVQGGHNVHLNLPHLNGQIFIGVLDADRNDNELRLSLASDKDEHSIVGIFHQDEVTKSLRKFKVIIYRHPLRSIGYPLSVVATYDMDRRKGRIMLQKLEPTQYVDLYEESDEEKLPASIDGSRHFNRTLDLQFALEGGKKLNLDLVWQTKEFLSSVELGVDMSRGLSLSTGYRQAYQNRTDSFYAGSEIGCIHERKILTCKLIGKSSRPKLTEIFFKHHDDGSKTSMLFDIFLDRDDALLLEMDNGKKTVISFSQPNQVLFQVQKVKSNIPSNTDVSWLLNVLGWSIETQISRHQEDSQCSWSAMNFGLQGDIVYNSLIVCPTEHPKFLATILGNEENVGLKIESSRTDDWKNVNFKLTPSRRNVAAITVDNRLDIKNPKLTISWDTQSIGSLIVNVPRVAKDLMEKTIAFPSPSRSLSFGFASTNVVDHFKGLMKELRDVLVSFSNEWTPFRVNNLSDRLASSFDVVEGWTERLLKFFHRMKLDVKSAVKKSSKIFMRKITSMKVKRYEASRRISATWNRLFTLPNFLQKFSLEYIYAQISALDENDDKTLETTISRYVNMIKENLGEFDGIPGVLKNTALMEFEKALKKTFTWKTLKNLRSALRTQVNTVIPLTLEYEDKKLTLASKDREEPLNSMQFSLVESWYSYITSQIHALREKYPKLRRDLRFFLSAKVEGQAFVIGNSTALSFDGKVIDLTSLTICPHVLVTLLNEKLTSIVIQFKKEEGIEKRILMFMDQDTMIQVDNMMQLTINGRIARERLINIGRFTVEGSSDQTKIDHNSGLLLHCFREPSYCKITVDEHLFANTAGVLGIYDRDINTDYFNNQWREARNTNNWRASTRIGLSTVCVPRSLGSNSSTGFHHDNFTSKATCSRMFSSDNNKLSGCMTKIMPAPFKEACQLSDSCAVESLYTGKCQERWFDEAEKSLEGCEPCKKAESTLYDTSNSTHEILILGNSSCIDHVDDLIEELRKHSSRKTKIIFREMDILRRVRIPSGVDEKVFTFGEWDPWHHVMEILDLDFSHTSIKSVILLDCGIKLCNVQLEEFMKADLLLKLLQRSSPVYLITNERLALTKEDKVRKKYRKQLIGMDTKTVYLMSHAKRGNLRGRPKLIKYLEVPESNSCAHIALESDGAIFSTKLIKKKPQHHNYFHKLIGMKVEDGTRSSALQCRRCPCRKHCTVCESLAMRPDIDELLEGKIVEEGDYEDYEDYEGTEDPDDEYYFDNEDTYDLYDEFDWGNIPELMEDPDDFMDEEEDDDITDEELTNEADTKKYWFNFSEFTPNGTDLLT